MEGEITSLPIIRMVVSVAVGMLGVPIGMLPSIIFFRALADGTDASETSKKLYAATLWSGMLAGWVGLTLMIWWVLGQLSG